MSPSAPKRRLDVRQTPGARSTGTGRRVASRARRRRSTFKPSPAMLGALALVVAGLGSAAFSSHADQDALRANYQTISADYTGDGNEVDYTRSFDREATKRQTAQQAAGKIKADEELKQAVQSNVKKIKANTWVLPVTGYRLTARFGQRSALWSTVHTGLDFAGPSGSTIVSVAQGTVKSAGYEGAYGNRTVVTLLDGTEVWYCHQSRMVVQPGDKVGPGQIIGYSGSTGNVTGPHLHLEIHPGGGAAVDPEPVLRDHGITP
ncbi:M23 family metallopeptidase [Aeromicrobium sp. Root495]|uniref:M23 family metallopeptidase n=1 Tax=Aeromicrobium sp. Root495 TaxID=1736550 RepID=UPI000B24FCB0|nr:M23 family metallopeptidase [Aeromicrobium sp. Root495]